jgi:hypothetical protein
MGYWGIRDQQHEEAIYISMVAGHVKEVDSPKLSWNPAMKCGPPGGSSRSGRIQLGWRQYKVQQELKGNPAILSPLSTSPPAFDLSFLIGTSIG